MDSSSLTLDSSSPCFFYTKVTVEVLSWFHNCLLVRTITHGVDGCSCISSQKTRCDSLTVLCLSQMSQILHFWHAVDVIVWCSCGFSTLFLKKLHPPSYTSIFLKKHWIISRIVFSRSNTYFTTLKGLWEELNNYRPISSCSCGALRSTLLEYHHQ